MGLLKAAGAAIGSTLHDQWKDVISCENMGNDILMMKKTTDTGVISNKSIIRVVPGQCAVIMQNGKVLDATAEEGDYTFDQSTTPSFFAGNFGAVFKDMWQRFTFGGGTPNKQCVYYFNTKEIIDNKFGTATPVPYQDWSHPVPNQMTGGVTPLAVKVKCYGKYTFKIVDPATFLHEITGTADVYKKDDIVEQMRSEVIAVFQNILNELGTDKYKVPVLELPSQTDEIKQMMDERVFDEPIRRRGLSIVVFAVESVTLDEKSEEYIQHYILSSNANLQQGKLTEAYADAVKAAAENKSGSMNGFMGIGMMNMAGGNVFGAMGQNVANNTNTGANQVGAGAVSPEVQAQVAAAQKPVQPQAPAETPQEAPAEEVKTETTESNEWKCPKCGTVNTGKFCTECGEQKHEEKTCPKCGNVVDENQKFCPECGEKLQ